MPEGAVQVGTVALHGNDGKTGLSVRVDCPALQVAGHRRAGAATTTSKEMD